MFFKLSPRLGHPVCQDEGIGQKVVNVYVMYWKVLGARNMLPTSEHCTAHRSKGTGNFRVGCISRPLSVPTGVSPVDTTTIEWSERNEFGLGYQG